MELFLDIPTHWEGPKRDVGEGAGAVVMAGNGGITITSASRAKEAEDLYWYW
jgi:hypothetical protein